LYISHIWLENAYSCPPPNYAILGFDPINAEVYQQTRKRHILAWKDIILHINRQNRSTNCKLCAWWINQKDKKKPYSGKLGIRPDHPRCPIEIPFGVVGGLPTVISFKFHQHRLNCEGTKFGSSHYLGHWLIQQLYSCMAVMLATLIAVSIKQWPGVCPSVSVCLCVTSCCITVVRLAVPGCDQHPFRTFCLRAATLIFKCLLFSLCVMLCRKKLEKDLFSVSSQSTGNCIVNVHI